MHERLSVRSVVTLARYNARTSFWIEGEEIRAACHDRLCKAWIEPNSVDDERIDCGWPSAQKLEHAVVLAKRRECTQMRAEAEANTAETTDVVDASEFDHILSGASIPSKDRPDLRALAVASHNLSRLLRTLRSSVISTGQFS